MIKQFSKRITPPFIWDWLKVLRHKGGSSFLKSKKWVAKVKSKKMRHEFSVDYVSAVAPFWLEYLKDLQGKPELKMLEIGCFEGRSTIWFLENVVTHPTSLIFCVDTFGRYGGEFRFDHNIKISGYESKIRKIKGQSEEVLQTLSNEKFDIVYVDGCHQAVNVLMDAIHSWIMLKPGGFIIFDDYEWEPDLPAIERPQMAIDLFLSAFQTQIHLLHRGYQVILRKEVG